MAASGERKTACDTVFRRPVREWQRDYEESHVDNVRRAQANWTIWEHEREGLLSKIKSRSGGASRKSGPSFDELKEQLQDHVAKEPKLIPFPRLFAEDATPEGLVNGLAAGQWPSISIWSDEAGMVVGSHAFQEKSAMRFLSLLNRLWDGGEIIVQRAKGERIVRGRRLTVALMGQPSVINRLLKDHEGLARTIGLVARYLIAWPESTRGTRRFKEGDLSAPLLQAFNHRIRELLDLPLPWAEGEGDHGLAPPVLALSPGAFEVWRAFHDDIEKELLPEGDLAEMADVASSTAEQAARLYFSHC